MGGRGCDSAEGRVEWEGGGVTPQRGGWSGREGVCLIRGEGEGVEWEGGGVSHQRGGVGGRP